MVPPGATPTHMCVAIPKGKDHRKCRSCQKCFLACTQSVWTHCMTWIKRTDSSEMGLGLRVMSLNLAFLVCEMGTRLALLLGCF